jgi:hypothetical protein
MVSDTSGFCVSSLHVECISFFAYGARKRGRGVSSYILAKTLAPAKCPQLRKMSNNTSCDFCPAGGGGRREMVVGVTTSKSGAPKSPPNSSFVLFVCWWGHIRTSSLPEHLRNSILDCTKTTLSRTPQIANPVEAKSGLVRKVWQNFDRILQTGSTMVSDTSGGACISNVSSLHVALRARRRGRGVSSYVCVEISWL